MSLNKVGGILSVGLDGINSPVTAVEYLVVAGGGACGNAFNQMASGGGGAGGAGHQPNVHFTSSGGYSGYFGGSRASGTNDKAGSKLNLLRWVSPRLIKENFNPPNEYPYPYMA